MQKFHSESRLLTNTFISLKTSTFLLSMFLLSFSLVCPAAVIKVPENYSTIQEAIDAASDGDEIIVSLGTYVENVHFGGKNITLRSADPTDASVVASTIIDGNKSGPVVTFSGTENETCVLSGFTITNGRALWGGGISGVGSHATIEFNSITTNTAYQLRSRDGHGGGLVHCDGLIQYNTISGNWADDCGAGLNQCDGIIQCNIISDNTADYRGGGLYYCDGVIQDNIISNNTAHGNGGGFYNCDATIQNNIVSDNLGRTGGGLLGCDGLILNNTISGNIALAQGGGLAGCDGTITGNSILNNTVIGNTTSYGNGMGGGLYRCGEDGSWPYGSIIENNIISGNSASHYGGGLAKCEGLIHNNTISGNSTVNYSGGGLAECTGYIQYNVISENSGGSWGNSGGGGLYACEGVIQFNYVSNNQAASGGGLHECSGTIRNNIVFGNKATKADGGGLNRCSDIIINNTICANTAYASGGGISSCWGLIINNTVADNDATYQHGGGLNFCQGFIINCIVFGNSALEAGAQVYESSTPIYSCIQHWAGGGIGNISRDPLFVDPTNGDYHLQSGSPCIDDGHYGYLLLSDYVADIDAQARIAGSSVDMGSDEYLSSPDLDGDFLSDANEAVFGSDSSMRDTDGDGLLDGMEVMRGSDPNVSNGPTGISIPLYWPTIQQGIFFAFPGETVIVSPGIYEEIIHFFGKNIILSSINPHDDGIRDSTIIDGNGSNSVVNFLGTEDESCRLRGFTIRNGHVYGNGGGVSGNGSRASIQYNVIMGNSCADSWSYGGGGIANCHGVIENNIVKSNTGSRGGGLFNCNGMIRYNIISGNNAGNGGGLLSCSATIQNNIISYNSAQSSGGGLCNCNGTLSNNIIFGNTSSSEIPYCGGGGLAWCEGTIQNNIISGNTAYKGGGVLIKRDDQVKLLNCTISENVAYESGGGVYYRYVITPTPTPFPPGPWRGPGQETSGGQFQDRSVDVLNGEKRNRNARQESAEQKPEFVNCIIWNNYNKDIGYVDLRPSVNYCCIKGGWTSGTGNIDADPMFVDNGRWTGTPGQSDWIQGDYHLRDSSPCIDAGGHTGLTQDFEGNPRPWDGTGEPRGDGSDFDIGADEFIGPIAFDFTSSQEGWTTGSAPVAFSVPQYIYRQGCVTIVSQNNTNTFGFWGSPDNAILVTEGCIYRARFVVSTDVPDPWLVPQIRLRVNARNLQQADYLTIESSGDGGASPGVAGTTYDLYFVPPANAGYCILAFDLLNFNPSDAAYAELALESVVVERFDLEALGDPATICAYDFETSQEFWTPGDGTATFTDPGFFWADGALHLQSTTNTSTFGYWGSDPADITIEEGRLYRGTFEVRTDEPDRSRVPQMRLRFNTANMQASRSFEVASAGDGANSPGITNTTYDRLYFLPPANCVGEGLLVSFDIFNFLPDEAVADASLILDWAIIESLSPPVLP